MNRLARLESLSLRAELDRDMAEARAAFANLTDASRDRLVESIVPGRSIDGLTGAHKELVAYLARLGLRQILLPIDES